MARSHREIFSFVVGFIVLYIGAVVTTNCNSSSVSPVVPFCSNMQVSGRRVYLSGIDNRTNGIGCNCSISLTSDNQYPIEIEIKNVTNTSNLCDYSLYSVYRNTSTRLYSCGEQLHKRSFDISPTEGLGLHMETGTDNAVGFSFCLALLLTGSGSSKRMSLRCRSNSTTTSQAHTTHKSSTTTNPSSVFHSVTTPQPNNDSDSMIGIIIGAIIAVMVVITLVIIIICLVKRRKKKPPYATPHRPQDRPHNQVHEAIKPNNYVDCRSNHNTQVGSQGMIYLENDHYNSVDNNVPIGPKAGSHEGMIYLENDLYISSNENDNVHQDAENTVPHQPVEYDVVNKTAKKGSNGAASGHTVGPHGDEYTLVQKK